MNVINYDFVNKFVSFITFSNNGTIFTFITVYLNSVYKSKIDHCLVDCNVTSFFINCFNLDSVINLSDHKPILLRITFPSINDNRLFVDSSSCNVKKIKLVPNLENEEINGKCKQ